MKYKKYLEKIQELSEEVMYPKKGTIYPTNIDTQVKQSLFDKLDFDEILAVVVDAVIMNRLLVRGWISGRGSFPSLISFKEKR